MNIGFRNDCEGLRSYIHYPSAYIVPIFLSSTDQDQVYRATNITYIFDPKSKARNKDLDEFKVKKPNHIY